MVDCYNVTALTKSEDDELDEKIFEARYASQAENAEKNQNNESTEEEEDFVNDMAKRMLHLCGQVLVVKVHILQKKQLLLY